jgi:hypothetical protein
MTCKNASIAKQMANDGKDWVDRKATDKLVRDKFSTFSPPVGDHVPKANVGMAVLKNRPSASTVAETCVSIFFMSKITRASDLK